MRYKKAAGVIGSAALSQLNIFKGLRLAAFALFAFAAGCAAPQKMTQRFFWPPLPDRPKVEWIGTYASQRDIKEQSLLQALVGEETISFEKPTGIASDGKGTVYVTDVQAGTVLVYDFNQRKVEPLLKDENAGLFMSPRGVAVDSAGNIYVSDTDKNRVFAFTRDRRPLFSIGEGILDWPGGIAVDNERKRLYVVNIHVHNVAVFDLSGTHLFTFSRKGDRDGYLNFPTDLDLDSKGNVVVADSMNARVQVFDSEGRFLMKFGQRGDSLTDFQLIKGIAVDRKTDNIYVTDGRANRFLIFSPKGEALLAVGGTYSTLAGRVVPGGFLLPQDISIDENGRVYVADSINKRFQVYQIVDDAWLKEHPIEKDR